MTKVILESWREGLQKISLSKLQNEKLGMSLMDSKKNVDMLLDNHSIVFEIEDEIIAQEFLVEANRLGVNCKILE
ncbi:hypothetical protein N4T20_02810 [Flavobacterium sp. TR2]|uniref:hypothetical protein n=1 Tax=Flavobacterium sp. TR2 TaxID=2977321 RepID=UPI0021B11880|nr:hypothetical protein [Flavobacterium sp. TR2]UWY28863.1 hypothetical protein N4T20_02810 [Flavobacterium sp. TR2]